MAKVAADIFAHYYIAGRNALAVTLIVSVAWPLKPFNQLVAMTIGGPSTTRDLQHVRGLEEGAHEFGLSQQPQEL